MKLGVDSIKFHADTIIAVFLLFVAVFLGLGSVSTDPTGISACPGLSEGAVCSDCHTTYLSRNYVRTPTINATANVTLDDDIELYFGDSQNISIFYNSTADRLHIKLHDKDIEFIDGSGNTILYLDESTNILRSPQFNVTSNITLDDDVELYFGDAQNISVFYNSTADRLYVKLHDKDIEFVNESGDTIIYLNESANRLTASYIRWGSTIPSAPAERDCYWSVIGSDMNLSCYNGTDWKVSTLS